MSYVKANAADLIRDLKASGEATQETLALLEILALGRRQVEQRRTEPADEVFRRLASGRPSKR